MGLLFNQLLTFLFIIVKLVNKLNKDLHKHKKEEAKEEVKEAPKSEEVLLLEEIRDLLKSDVKKKGKSK